MDVRLQVYWIKPIMGMHTTAWTQDDSKDGGGRAVSGTTAEVERPKGFASRQSGDRVEERILTFFFFKY